MRRWIVLAMAALALASGCGRGARVAPETVALRTREALLEILIGPPPESQAILTAPLDLPVLQAGKRETALLAVDSAAFVRLGRGAFRDADIQALERETVESANRVLRRRGFTMRSVSFPAALPTDDATVLATLSPLLQPTGSPEDRRKGRGKDLVLVRLTLVDRAGAILAQRDYFSGRDIPQN